MKRLPAKIRKRNGSIVAFEPEKIRRALLKACLSTLENENEAARIASRSAEEVLSRIKPPGRKHPTIEDIQDLVEDVLISGGNGLIAKSYILYRKEHQDLRDTKAIIGIADDLKLPVNSLLVLKNRYLLKNDQGRVIETPGELFQRVARTVSRAELNYGGAGERRSMQEAFYRMMAGREFLPNSPTLMNAGTAIGQLSACFVLPVEDSLESIFETVKNMALIHRTGGGTGFDFSRIRARGELVSTTKGRASGPISFMSIFNQTTDVIIQGGRRRGANMGILRCDHPDVFEFVEAKLSEGVFSNFNLSVAVTDRFINAVKKNGMFDLLSPHTKKKVRSVKARALFDLICFSAWRSGDPGLIFIDEINRRNVTPQLGNIEATNPCSEVLLLPYESCNLGSINLAAMVHNGKLSWEKIRHSVHLGVRFLDNVIDVTRYPLPCIKRITGANRKIGLGVMGFADALVKLGISYAEPRAEALARKIMKFVQAESRAASAELAGRRGPFPNIAKSLYHDRGVSVRNATMNAIAPTGTISIIAGCSSGIEPLFSLSYTRTVMDGTKLFEVHPEFKAELKRRNLYSQELMSRVTQGSGIQGIARIPRELRRLFVTSFDVAPQQHLRIQAAFQKHTDNSVSKTINLPVAATVEDVREIYLSAYALKCKGITVYRYGSRQEQVLSFGAEQPNEPGDAGTPADPSCPTGQCEF